VSTGAVVALVLSVAVACFALGAWTGFEIGSEDRRADPWNRERKNIEQLARDRHRREQRERKEAKP